MKNRKVDYPLVLFRSLIIATAMLPILAVAGCGSDADKVSKNLSVAAEQFEIQRKIIGINGITDKVLFEIDGRCSVELGATMPDVLDVICKHGNNDYRKHYVGLSDNVTFVSTQLENVDASVYHTRIILKPENLIPNIDLVTGAR